VNSAQQEVAAQRGDGFGVVLLPHQCMHVDDAPSLTGKVRAGIARDGTTGTQILYVNGVESGRSTCPAGFVDTGILGIGHGIFAGGRTDYVNGSISDVGVINRVLTPAEVTMLFNKGRTYVPPPPPDAGPDVATNDGGTDVPPDAPGGDGAID